ncbi:MAG: hypothetical protein ACM3ST_03460 [Bdellovibrio bacteriovorus]
MADPDTARESDERRRHRVRLARLEADLAYFQARLEIIGEPDSTNQMAQRKVFKLLHRSVAERVLRAKRQYVQMA